MGVTDPGGVQSRGDVALWAVVWGPGVGHGELRGFSHP